MRFHQTLQLSVTNGWQMFSVNCSAGFCPKRGVIQKIGTSCRVFHFPLLNDYIVTPKHLVELHLFIGYRLFHVDIPSKIIRHIKTGLD